MLGNFDENFSIIHIDNNNKELMNKSFQLRYRMFCLEKGLFPGSPHEKVEQDEYEAFSEHALLFYKPTKMYIGTVRLILGRLLGPRLFPIEIAAKSLFFDKVDFNFLQKEHMCEISRLAILPEFRPKFAVLGLLRAILEMSIKNQIFYFYAPMEPRIERVLQRIGIKFTQISPVLNYNGQRQCYLGFTEELLGTTQTTNPLIWELLTDKGKLKPPSILVNSKLNEEID